MLAQSAQAVTKQFLQERRPAPRVLQALIAPKHVLIQTALTLAAALVQPGNFRPQELLPAAHVRLGLTVHQDLQLARFVHPVPSLPAKELQTAVAIAWRGRSPFPGHRRA